jgi:uncharacterized DUF497 family protein
LATVFEWDPRGEIANRRKQGVSFAEASTVFNDPLAKIFPDHDSGVAAREIIVGHSLAGRLMVVSFIEWMRDTVRIMSARQATRTERNDYGEAG